MSHEAYTARGGQEQVTNKMNGDTVGGGAQGTRSQAWGSLITQLSMGSTPPLLPPRQLLALLNPSLSTDFGKQQQRKENEKKKDFGLQHKRSQLTSFHAL